MTGNIEDNNIVDDEDIDEDIIVDDQQSIVDPQSIVDRKLLEALRTYNNIVDHNIVDKSMARMVMLMGQ